jgi:acetate kinase
VVLYLMQQENMSPADIEDLLYRRSGLLGVSAQSADMGVLLESAGRGPHEAVELFAFRIARETGALMSVAGGLDGFVFTAGIGEHEPDIRQFVAERLAWTGLKIDPSANARGAGLISAPDSSIRVWVLPTDEEAVIAQQAAGLLNTQNQRERQVRPV